MNRGQLNLQWDAYSDHLQGMLQEIIANDSFSDVTLVTDDKKQVKAHRNILSSCSSVFKEIFQIGAISNHQVIYLRGIQHSEIESILHFIYLGEAKVDRMKEFIEVANNLDIRGLSDFASFSEVTQENEDKQANSETENHEVTHLELQVEDMPLEVVDAVDDREKDAQSKTPSLSMEEDENEHCKAFQKIEDADDSLKKNNKKELSSSIDKFKLEGNKFHCNWCIYQASSQRYVTLHIQRMHEGVKYACNQCDKHYQSKSAVQGHIKSAHKEFRYDGMGHLIASCEESRRCAYPSCKGRARFQCAKCDVGLHPQCFYYYHSYEEMKEIRRSNAAVVVKEDIK